MQYFHLKYIGGWICGYGELTVPALYYFKSSFVFAGENAWNWT